MARNYEATRFRSARFDGQLVLAGARGERRLRSLKGLFKLVDGGAMARLMRFSAPADLNGAATLTIERPQGTDDLWLYLPAMRRVRRLVSANKRDAWVGSEFSLGDITGHKVADWRYTITGETAVGGAAATVVNCLPATRGVASDTGYSRRVCWISRANGLMLQMDCYDLTGALSKRQTIGDVQTFANAPGKAQPMRAVMQNLQTNAVTTFTLSNFVANGPIGDGDVAPSALAG